MSTPAIELVSVSKSFRGRPVLREVSGSIMAGRIVALVGESGSGKTTLLRCVNGLEGIDAGYLNVAGHRIDAHASDDALTRVRLDVGMVLQDYQLFPHLSVLDNLCLAPQVVRKKTREEAEKRARELLDQVGLADRHGSRPRELSGGQKQRVALARALAQDVKVLLLDEPTSALDEKTRDEVIENLRRLVKRSATPLTLLLVTHDLQLAQHLADELWTLDAGRLVSSEG